MPCNPVNITDPLGPWDCATSLAPSPPKNFPEQCSEFEGVDGICQVYKPRYTYHNISLADCCTEANKKGQGIARGVAEWNYNHDNSTCDLYFMLKNPQ
jgi:hypothetical protein